MKRKKKNYQKQKAKDMKKQQKFLSYDQLLLYNDYINSKKNRNLKKKNDKIKNLLDNLELKNEQKGRYFEI